MAQSKVSILRQLETTGYLSLSQFVKYLKEYAPEAYVSYPTALKLVREGKMNAKQMGYSYRITRTEAERWISEGNFERKLQNPYDKSY